MVFDSKRYDELLDLVKKSGMFVEDLIYDNVDAYSAPFLAPKL